MSNRPTSRQLQGFFNAIRASINHTNVATIDIAPGNYGSGKVFPGVVGVSDPSWISATHIFYIYLDQTDALVLNNIAGFPVLCTKIARLEIVGGVIIDVIDERAEVNGLTDAYQVAFDDGGMHIATPANDVQAALQLLDAYIASGPSLAPTLKYIDLDVGGGIKNGLVKYSHLDDAPAIEFPKRPMGIGRVRYSVSVPRDWLPGTNIVFRLFWSPEDSETGNVNWRLSYRTLMSGTSADTTMTVVSIAQSTPGVTDQMIDTGENLIIPAANIDIENLLIVNFEREYSIQDTYNSTARMHLVRMEYTGKIN